MIGYNEITSVLNKATSLKAKEQNGSYK